MAKVNGKSAIVSAAAFTVLFDGLEQAINLYAKQVVADKPGWEEADVISPPFSKYVWIESQPGKAGGLELVALGEDKFKRDQASADGKEKARHVWNDESGNPRRLVFARFTDEKRGAEVCTQLQNFWRSSTLRPAQRFALLTDPAARELAGMLLAHFPYANQGGGGPWAPRGQRNAERAKGTVKRGIQALASLKKRGEAVDVNDDERRIMMELAGVPQDQIARLLTAAKAGKSAAKAVKAK